MLVPINHHPSRSQLLTFGICWLAFFGMFALTAWARHSTITGAWVGTLAIAVPALGFVCPPFLRLVYVAMSYVTWPLGVVFSLVILLAVFYLVITPAAWILWLFRYDPMQRKWDRSASTYWTRRSPPDTVKRYFKQH